MTATAIVGLSIQEVAVDQRLDLLTVDELLGDVETATRIPPSGLDAGLGNDHPIQVGIAGGVIIIHGAIGTGGEVLERPPSGDSALGRGVKVLQPDRGREGDVAGGRRRERVLELPGGGSFTVFDLNRVLGTRLEEPGRIIGDRGGSIGLGDRRGHRGTVEGQLNRGCGNRAG